MYNIINKIKEQFNIEITTEVINLIQNKIGTINEDVLIDLFFDGNGNLRENRIEMLRPYQIQNNIQQNHKNNKFKVCFGNKNDVKLIKLS